MPFCFVACSSIPGHAVASAGLQGCQAQTTYVHLLKMIVLMPFACFHKSDIAKKGKFVWGEPHHHTASLQQATRKTNTLGLTTLCLVTDTYRGSLVAVAAGRMGLLGRDLARLVADNEGADGEGLLLLLVGGVVEARASLQNIPTSDVD